MKTVDRGAEAPLVAVGGLVASGKSSVSSALCERLDAVRIEADRIQQERLGQADAGAGPADASTHEAGWENAFGRRAEDEIYLEMLRRAEIELSAGRAVVLDGCFSRAHQRLEARAIALAHGRDFLFVECRVPIEVSRRRLRERDAASGTAGWQALFDGLLERWEPVGELASREHAVVYSEGETSDVLFSLEARIVSPSAPVVARTDRRVVTFDCWNTLLIEDDWPLAHRLRVEELRRAALEAGREVSSEEAGRAFDVAWARHMEAWRQGGATGAHQVAADGLAELGFEGARPAVQHLTRVFEEASHSSGVRALEGARETIGALESAGVACGLVCDTGLTPGRVVRRHLAREGLLRALVVQSFSDEVGAPKPDARTFAAVLEPLGIAPERAVHVGDLRRTDVAGARALGMTSVRIRQSYDDASDEHPDADHVVDSHADLLELLRALDVLE